MSLMIQSFSLNTHEFVQVKYQKTEVQSLQESGLSSLLPDQALKKVCKGAEMVMRNAFLLQRKIRQARVA